MIMTAYKGVPAPTVYDPAKPERPTVDRPIATPGLLDFALPPNLEASEPPEARGLARDEVRLMVSQELTGRDALATSRTAVVDHAQFRDLPRFLNAGGRGGGGARGAR